MKNFAVFGLSALFAVGVLFTPAISYAQVASSTPSHDQYVQSLQNALNQALQLLSQLVAELQSMSANQATIATQLNVLSQDATPIAGSTGSGTIAVMDTPAPTCELTAEIVGESRDPVGKITWQTTDAVEGGLDNGVINFTQDFLDNGILAGNSISNGYARSLALSGKYVQHDASGDIVFSATVYGIGGKKTGKSATCKASITQKELADFRNATSTDTQ